MVLLLFDWFTILKWRLVNLTFCLYLVIAFGTCSAVWMVLIIYIFFCSFLFSDLGLQTITWCLGYFILEIYQIIDLLFFAGIRLHFQLRGYHRIFLKLFRNFFYGDANYFLTFHQTNRRLFALHEVLKQFYFTLLWKLNQP